MPWRGSQGAFLFSFFFLWFGRPKPITAALTKQKPTRTRISQKWRKSAQREFLKKGENAPKSEIPRDPARRKESQKNKKMRSNGHRCPRQHFQAQRPSLRMYLHSKKPLSISKIMEQSLNRKKRNQTPSSLPRGVSYCY